MHAPLRARVALLGLGVALLGACGGDDDNPAAPTGNEGEVRFTYSGTTSGGTALSGSHRARGTLDPSAAEGAMPFATWAVGARAGADSLAVASFVVRQQSPAMGDLFGMVLPHVTGATRLDFSFTCETDCPVAVFVIGAQPGTGGDVFGTTAFEYACVLLSGSVNVTSVTTARARGTFGGQAYCVRASDVTTLAATVTVSGGSFDVPIRGDLGIPTFP